ncbi:hypothetical protein VQL36_08840 [Chengkuizengella sp. SCS-71B]|uniref:hypothetical protein n=1 Tax=Chengkuizengella sp. SCS-71B TaxID=3115290 RepID=UPI0032C21821
MEKKVLGWIFIPYIMVFLYWKKISIVPKVLGTFWAVYLIFFVVTNLNSYMETVHTSTIHLTDSQKKWINTDLNENTIKEELEMVTSEKEIYIDEVEVKFIEVQKDSINIHVNYIAFDETDFIETIAHTMALYSEVLFLHPKTEEVTLSGYTLLMNEEGNLAEEKVVNITWLEKTSDKLNYENFSEKVEFNYTSVFNLADSYIIHPAIFSNLKGKPGNFMFSR